MENITKNTKLYKISCRINKQKEEIYYRDLNTLEYSFLINIKNEGIRNDIAGKLVIVFRDVDTIPFGVRMNIGQDIINRTQNFCNSSELIEISIAEFRESILQDEMMMAIKQILNILPGQSYTELLKLNIKDLIELACLCELLIGKPIFKKHGLLNGKLPDDGKSLQEKMNALNKQLGGIPK